MSGTATTDSALLQRKLRIAHFIRAATLLIIGFTVAFTAPLHSDLVFDALVSFIGLGLISVATLIEYWSLRPGAESWWVAARAIVALGAAGALLAVVDPPSYALVIALWAALTAIITALRLAYKAQPTRVAVPSLLLSVALAVTCLLVRNDPIAIIGFFGAYALIRGVFLAIAAFDTRNDDETETQQAAEEIATEVSN